MNIFDFENPVSGKKGNLLDFMGIWKNVLGVAMLFMVTFLGQGLANKVSGFVPNVDTRGTSLIQTNQPVQKTSGKVFY